MKIKFLIDYRGRETHEITVPVGTVMEVDDEARHLINAGLAMEVKEKPVAMEKTVKPAAGRSKGRKK